MQINEIFFTKRNLFQSFCKKFHFCRFMKTISLKIKKLSDDKNIPIKELAGAIGKSPRSIYNYIDQKTVIDIETLKKIASFFEVSVSYFFNEQGADCERYKKGYSILRKYRYITTKDVVHYQQVFDYFRDLIIEREGFEDLLNYTLKGEKLWDKFYLELYNIYEVQELFIKSYFTEKTDGKLPEYKRWEKYESKIKVKSHEDALYPLLDPLKTISIRKGYEKYFSTHVM